MGDDPIPDQLSELDPFRRDAARAPIGDESIPVTPRERLRSTEGSLTLGVRPATQSRRGTGLTIGPSAGPEKALGRPSARRGDGA